MCIIPNENQKKALAVWRNDELQPHRCFFTTVCFTSVKSHNFYNLHIEKEKQIFRSSDTDPQLDVTSNIITIESFENNAKIIHTFKTNVHLM